MMCEHDSQCTGPGLGEKGAEPPCKADDPLAACFIRLSNRQTQCKGDNISSNTPRRQMHVGSAAVWERRALTCLAARMHSGTFPISMHTPLPYFGHPQSSSHHQP